MQNYLICLKMGTTTLLKYCVFNILLTEGAELPEKVLVRKTIHEC